VHVVDTFGSISIKDFPGACSLSECGQIWRKIGKICGTSEDSKFGDGHTIYLSTPWKCS